MSRIKVAGAHAVGGVTGLYIKIDGAAQELRDSTQEDTAPLREKAALQYINVLPIALSGYRSHADSQRNPDLLCARARRDETLMPQIQAVWQANMRLTVPTRSDTR